MTSRMSLAIVGSRRFANPDWLRLSKMTIAWFLANVRPSGVVSGGAMGIDTLAEEQAKLLGFPVRVFLPERRCWESYRERNLQVVCACDALLCIRDRDSSSFGSGWTRDAAVKAGKPVWSVEIPPDRLKWRELPMPPQVWFDDLRRKRT